MDEIMQNFLKVTMYSQHMYVTRVEEVAAYTLDQLFSDIGKCTFDQAELDLNYSD